MLRDMCVCVCVCLLATYFIPKLKDKADRIIESCIKCIIVNAKSGKKGGFLTSIDKL